MLQLSAIRLRRGHRQLFDGLDMELHPGQRVGLVGPNGAGKTTLLRVLCGDLGFDEGDRIVGGGDIGYLPQQGLSFAGRTLFAEVRSAASQLVELEGRMQRAMAEIERLAAGDPDHERALARYERAESAYRNADGYRLDAHTGRILAGLGFGAEQWDRPCETFSGGWQMRIALARLLVEDHAFLLLDEPTNHLDIEARTWLERHLASWSGGLLLVSHDRHFLDAVIDRVVELDDGRTESYRGSYSRYLEERELRRAQRLAAWEQQQQQIAHLNSFIERFRAKASKATQVQSRVKQLAKLEKLRPPKARPRVVLRFPEPSPTSEVVLRAHGVSRSYGSLDVLAGVGLTISRGQKVALMGPNGAGKSTLLRLLAHVDRPQAGRVDLGHGVKIAWFAQDQTRELDPAHTVLEELAVAAPWADQTRLRDVLGGFLFRGEDVFKKVGVLSGGEKNRLALARVVLSDANVLLLDEPTNHLDMQSREVLSEALARYEGTVVFVSHDRHFTAALATSVVEVGGLSASWYPEGLEDFLWRKAAELGHTERRVPGRPAPDTWFLAVAERELTLARERRGLAIEEEPTAAASASPKLSGKERRERQKRRQRLRRQVSKAEARVEELGEQLAQLDEQLAAAGGAGDWPEMQRLQQERDQVAGAQTSEEERWEELMEELEELGEDDE